MATLLVSTLVGALVGYVTNVVAVQLLFRPYRPVRIPLLGLRVQGLIPAKKEEFARRLGEIAEEYLKTPRLQRDLQSSMEEAARSAIENALRGMLRSNPILYAALEGYVAKIADAVSESIVSPILQSLASSAAGRVRVGELVAEQVSALDSREMEALFRRIAGRELRFIELAGLALGAVIGLAEGLVLVALQ